MLGLGPYITDGTMSMVTRLSIYKPEPIIGRVMNMVSTYGQKVRDVHKKSTRLRYWQNRQVGVEIIVILLYER